MCVWPPGSVWQKTCQLTPLQSTADHGVGAQSPQSVTATPAPHLTAPLKTNGSSVCCVAPGTSHGLGNKHSELRRRKPRALSYSQSLTGRPLGVEGKRAGPLAAGAAGAACPQQVRAAGRDGVSPGPVATCQRFQVASHPAYSVLSHSSLLWALLGTAVLEPVRLCCPLHRSSVTALARGHGDRGSRWHMTADAVGRAEGQ